MIEPIKNVSFGSKYMGKQDIRIIPSSNPTGLEESIEKQLDVKPSPTVIKKFANGETYINIKEDMRNKDVYIMPTTGKEVNDNLMETYLKADASRRMGANRVIAILPNFPYGRQERKSEDGEPISARLNLALLHASGVDEVITTDIHAPALQGFAREVKLTDLESTKEMVDYFKDKINPENTVVVSPDLGGAKRADKFAKALDCGKAIIYKNRAAHNEAKAEMLLGDVEGKDCIIVKYVFGNVSGEEPASFMFAFSDYAFQNGVGLNEAYILDDSANYSSDNQSKEIKKGATLEVEVAYELNDTTSPVEIEVEELFSFDEKTITKTFTIAE